MLWAVEPDDQPWDYALLTGTSSIQHALRCAAAVGCATGSPRPDWVEAADVMCSVVACAPDAFEPKERWAMDWYYPVLTSAIGGVDAKIRLGDGWPVFAMERLGIRCVSDEPWVTASETAEAAIAHAAIGDFATAKDLLRWTRGHRRPDGSYVTGLVHPQSHRVPGRRVHVVHGGSRDPGRRRDHRCVSRQRPVRAAVDPRPRRLTRRLFRQPGRP